MYNQNDILAALQNGQDPQELANQFADALNAALKQKAEADKKAAEAKAKADLEAKRLANLHQEKVELVDTFLADLFDFIEQYYPEIYDKSMREHLPAEQLVNAMDQARDEIVNKMSYLGALFADNDKRPMRKKDPIEDFLRSNGLV